VARFELVPLAELGRPRIDVLCNMSGIFRDSFQNVVELLDDLFQVCRAFHDLSAGAMAGFRGFSRNQLCKLRRQQARLHIAAYGHSPRGFVAQDGDGRWGSRQCTPRSADYDAHDATDVLTQRAAAADEPDDMNFVRRHAAAMRGAGVGNATARLFSNPAGDYGSMV